MKPIHFAPTLWLIALAPWACGRAFETVDSASGGGSTSSNGSATSSGHAAVGGAATSSGSDASSGGATSANGGSTTSTAAAGGGMGAGGMGAGDVASSSTGAGGAGGCPCSPLQYCGSDNHCHACASFNRFRFASPVRLDDPSHNPGSNANFPRETARFGNGKELFYSFGEEPDQTRLASDDGAPIGPYAGGVKLQSPANTQGFEAPLPAPAGFMATAPYSRFDVVFTGPDSHGKTTILQMTADGSGGWSQPEPFQGPPFGDASAAHLAMDFDAGSHAHNGRVWWVIGSAPPSSRLVTWAVSGDPQPVPLQLTSSCEVATPDPQPYVANGYLFFTAPLPSGCVGSTADAHNHLYYTKLDASTGQQADMKATLITSLAVPGVDDFAPAMSGDLCGIYFSSNRDTGPTSGATDLYYAARD